MSGEPVTVEVRCPRCGRFVFEGVFDAVRVRHCQGYFLARATPAGLVIQSLDVLPARRRPA